MPRQTKVKYSQAKYVRKTTEGRCPYCHKTVQSLEAHMKIKHKGEKLIKK